MRLSLLWAATHAEFKAAAQDAGILHFGQHFKRLGDHLGLGARWTPDPGHVRACASGGYG